MFAEHRSYLCGIDNTKSPSAGSRVMALIKLETHEKTDNYQAGRNTGNDPVGPVPAHWHRVWKTGLGLNSRSRKCLLIRDRWGCHDGYMSKKLAIEWRSGL